VGRRAPVAEREPHRLIASLQERRRRHRERHVIVRALFVAAGFTVVAAGLVMMLLPGPALVVIPIGLAMLALEFAWAERLLEHAISQAERAKATAARTSRPARLLAGIAGALVVGALVAWAVVGDVPLLPV
jgi:uncharacterized protein (TIGR02611 family)